MFFSLFSPLFNDQSRPFFTNHDGSCIGIATDYSWHDGSIDDSQVFNSVNFKFRIYHSWWIRSWPHLAGAHRMVNCQWPVLQQAFQVIIRKGDRIATAKLGYHNLQTIFLEVIGLSQFQRPFQSSFHDFHILGMAVIVWLDDWWNKGILWSQLNVATTFWSQERRQKQSTISVTAKCFNEFWKLRMAINYFIKNCKTFLWLKKNLWLMKNKPNYKYLLSTKQLILNYKQKTVKQNFS